MAVITDPPKLLDAEMIEIISLESLAFQHHYQL